MTKKNLEKYLYNQGCIFVRYGAKHDIWQNPITKKQGGIGRHREIPLLCVIQLCRQLGILVPQ
jgi:hypothetical protein